MCSLKREVKVKVTKFCVGREELINVNKLTKFDFCIINGLWETKLNATAKRKLLTPDRRTDGQTDGQTDGFRQFIDRTCFAIRSKTILHNVIDSDLILVPEPWDVNDVWVTLNDLIMIFWYMYKIFMFLYHYTNWGIEMWLDLLKKNGNKYHSFFFEKLKLIILGDYF